MNFTQTLLARLSHTHLLKHPLYQAWTDGTLPLDAIRMYAQQYFHHVNAFPRYVSATHSGCPDLKSRQVLLDNLMDEERGEENHPELWLRFVEGLGVSRASAQDAEWLPETRELVSTFLRLSRSSYEEGLGALFAYEHQVPAIAEFKSEALRRSYQVTDPRALRFFEVHRQADVYHSEAAARLMEDLLPKHRERAAAAATEAGKALWGFLTGIQTASKAAA